MEVKATAVGTFSRQSRAFCLAPPARLDFSFLPNSHPSRGDELPVPGHRLPPAHTGPGLSQAASLACHNLHSHNNALQVLTASEKGIPNSIDTLTLWV